jgi:hypothetical protein
MSGDITNFNDYWHRIRSASAAFQKGIYHLYFLSGNDAQETFSKIVRTYQCLFQLCLTHLLLDFEYELDAKEIQGRLRNLCKSRNAPTRSEIDPAAIVKHSVFENKQWKGRIASHPLHGSSKKALALYHKTVDARHNLMYRPFMLETHWEDCTLMRLLGSVPEGQQIDSAYKEFFHGMLKLEKVERDELPKRMEASRKVQLGQPHRKLKPFFAHSFLSDLFKPYRDIHGVRPTESLLLTYARMLNPHNSELLTDIVTYRNKLIESQSLMEKFNIQKDWRMEEFFQ